MKRILPHVTAIFASLALGSLIAGPQRYHRGPITDLAEANNGSVSCSQAGILAFNQNRKAKTPLIATPFRALSVANVPKQGQQIAVGGGKPGESGIVALLDLSSGKFLHQRKISDDLVYSIAVDPASQTLAAACDDGSIVTMSLADFKSSPLTKRHQHTATARDVAFSPDGNWLASVGHDGVVFISAWPSEPDDAATPVRALAGHTDQVHCLVFSPDSLTIASGSKDGKIRLHQVNGPLLRTYADLGGGTVSDLVWSDDLGIFASTLQGTVHQLATNGDSSQILMEFPDPVFVLKEGPTPPLFDSLTAATGQYPNVVVAVTKPSSHRPPADSAQ